MSHQEWMPSVSPTNDALYLSASSISPAIENQGSVLAEHTSPSCILDERVPLQSGQPHPSPFLTPGRGLINHSIDTSITDDRLHQDFTSPASDTAPHWMQHVEEGRTAGPGEFPAAFNEQGAMTTTGSCGVPQPSIFPDTDATLGTIALSSDAFTDTGSAIHETQERYGDSHRSDTSAPIESYCNDVYDSNPGVNCDISPSEQCSNHPEVLDYLQFHLELGSLPASSIESTGASHELTRPNILQPVPSSMGSGEDAVKQGQRQEWLSTVFHQRVRKAEPHREHVSHSKERLCGNCGETFTQKSNRDRHYKEQGPCRKCGNKVGRNGKGTLCKTCRDGMTESDIVVHEKRWGRGTSGIAEDLLCPRRF